MLSSTSLYSNNSSNVSVRGNKGGGEITQQVEFTNIGVWEQTFQINNSFNNFTTCNSSIFCHQTFHVKENNIFIL